MSRRQTHSMDSSLLFVLKCIGYNRSNIGLLLYQYIHGTPPPTPHLSKRLRQNPKRVIVVKSAGSLETLFQHTVDEGPFNLTDLNKLMWAHKDRYRTGSITYFNEPDVQFEHPLPNDVEIFPQAIEPRGVALDVTREVVAVLKPLDWKTEHQWRYTAAGVSHICSHPSKPIVALAMTGMVKFWNIETGKMCGEIKIPCYSTTADISFTSWNQDGTYLAVAGENKYTSIWDTSSFKSVATMVSIIFNSTNVWDLSGRRVITVRYDRLELWSVTPQECVKTLCRWGYSPQHSSYHAAHNPTLPLAAFVRFDKNEKLLFVIHTNTDTDTDTDTTVDKKAQTPLFSSPLIDFLWSPSGKSIAVKLSHTDFRIVDSVSLELKYKLAPPKPRDLRSRPAFYGWMWHPNSRHMMFKIAARAFLVDTLTGTIGCTIKNTLRRGCPVTWDTTGTYLIFRLNSVPQKWTVLR